MRPRKKNRHLPSCVYLKHGAYWLVRKGKWVRLGTDLRSSLEAYALYVEGSAGTMPALIDEALLTIWPTVGRSTRSNYETAARKLKLALAAFRPEQVTAHIVWRLRDEMSDTPNMTNRCLSVLRQVMDYAVQRGVIQTNPAKEVKPHKEPPRARLLSAAEYAAIYEHAGPRLRVIMDLLYLTGQRVNDVLKLKRSDVTDDGVYFQQQKTGKKLCVRWTPVLRDTIDRAKALNTVPAVTLLQGRYRGAPDYRSVNLQWKTACKAAGVPDAQLRDLRAMSLTEAEQEGKNATALAGHSSPAMTKRYLRGKQIAQVDGPNFRQTAKSDRQGVVKD